MNHVSGGHTQYVTIQIMERFCVCLPKYDMHGVVGAEDGMMQSAPMPVQRLCVVTCVCVCVS